jgi:predicted small lipoprotein YifL
MKSLRCLFISVCLFAVTACGQKGDLYFPDKHSQQGGSKTATVLEHYGLF